MQQLKVLLFLMDFIVLAEKKFGTGGYLETSIKIDYAKQNYSQDREEVGSSFSNL